MTYTYSDREISDLHKDALGYRPDESWWAWWTVATPEEKQIEWDFLICRLQEANEGWDGQPDEAQEWYDYDPDC